MATKTTTKPTAPAETAEPATAERHLSRKDLLAALKVRGYAGPTSFTATTLRTVLTWVDSDCPRDAEGVPSGVMLAVHPDLRPARAARPVRLTKYQQGYQTALAEVAALAGDADGLAEWVEANRATVA